VRMPGMHGVDLYREIRELHPQLPVILMTAFALERLISEGIEEGVYSVVFKPFPMPDMLRLVRRAARGGAIMVVDDAAGVSESLARSLGTLGAPTVGATSAREALDLLARQPVDFCIVDLVMPDTSGAELCAAISRLDPEIGIVAMTGHDVPELMSQASRNGSQACLLKPFDMASLLKTVSSVRRRMAEGEPAGGGRRRP
jgi:two-component system response regulator HydG